VSNYLHRQIEISPPDARDIHGDVIILLGGGIYDGVADLSGTGAPVESSLARIVEAVRIYRLLNVPVITCGGMSPENRFSEASISARFLADLGIPHRDIITENRSMNTYENAMFAAEILKRRGFSRPVLVTSSHHLRRAVASFKKFGIHVTPVPSGQRTWTGMQYTWKDYLPYGYSGLARVLHEYLGLLYYRIRYL
jgi:uncharacterized SAM-binding protein YcdF (DUF218 family)